jgi:hypothetical protein
MPHRNEQPTLFELTGVDEFELPRGLPREQASRSVTPKSGSSTPEVNGSFREPGVFRADSPLTNMPLGEVCAACGCEIAGSGFVISRDPVPITAESSSGDRHPVGTGLDY